MTKNKEFIRVLLLDIKHKLNTLDYLCEGNDYILHRSLHAFELMGEIEEEMLKDE